MPLFKFTIPSSLADERIDKAMVALASGEEKFSRKQAKRLLDLCKVTLDGKVIQHAKALVRAGMELEFEWEPPMRHQLIDLAQAVLFQDEYVIAIAKPAGLPTHATHDKNRDHAVAAIKRLLASQGVEEPYVAVHHRLDVDTSGVLVFAISKDANKGLSAAFMERLAQKTYVAIVGRAYSTQDTWVVDNFLGRDRSSKRKKQMGVSSGGDHAQTEFRRLAISGEYALVEARPKTGRMHQIRVHLAERGTPISGDDLYGGEVLGAPCSRLALHARRLEIPHPVTNEPMEFSAELPDDMRQLADKLGLQSSELE